MTDPVVTTVDLGARKVARRVVVHAPPAHVFALVADPHRHPELDGSGTLRNTPISGPDRLTQGAKFSVGMKQYGVPYKITSTVIAFDEDKLVEWQHPLGHRWRWELVAIEPDSTQVTETFDFGSAKAPKMLELFGMPAKNAVGITKTLQALATRFG
jgi:uncharacterized protein YndB with AHSA1/START domain